MVAAEPADVAFHPAFLVCPFHAGLAVERIQAHVGPERGPSCGFHPGSGEPEHLGDRGLEVVVADLAGWQSA